MSESSQPTSSVPSLDAFPQYVATISRQGALLYVNRGGGLFGEAPKIGAPLVEVAREEVWRGLAGPTARAFERSEQSVVEIAVQGRWFECSIGPVEQDGQVVAAAIVATDVTRRRRTRAAIGTTEERFDFLVRATPDLYFRMDHNGVFRDYFGADDTFLPPSHFIGKAAIDVLPPPVGKMVQEAVAYVVSSKSSTTIDYALPDPVEGRQRYFEGRLFYDESNDVISVVRDVTDQRRTERALENSEESFHAVIEQMPDAITMHRNGSVRYANLACKRLLLIPDDEDVVGWDILSMVHADDRPRIVERIAEIEERGIAPATEMKLVRMDGEVVTVEVAPVRRLQLADGPVNLIVARDISQRRRMQERFLLADRVASMGTLAAGVAHEINNPLTYVVGNLAVAAKGLAAIEPRDEDRAQVRELEKAIADARAGAERVRYIVGDLRAFSRPDRGELTNIDLRKVLDGAINMAWSEIRHRARLVREYSDAPLVRGSETRLGQVFLNLLVNAAQAIEEGGATKNTIRVSTGTDEEGRALVEIQDSGVGFDANVSSRMWDPFYTTKPGEGTGLGLSICQSVVTSLGGEIVAETVSPKGALFRVLLPPFVGHLETPAPKEPPTTDETRIHGRVLVVDDEPVVATLVRRALEGHDVYIMTSGRDAVEMCKELEFDVIVCDLLMPDVTGMDLHDELVNLDPGFADRIVFMTAGAFTPKARRFLGRVTNPVVEKPFDLEGLAETVQRVLRRRRANELTSSPSPR
ncbi:MAG: PAS domain-containing protein [Deltaproteobacteria bacterium]|jgi:PAS domain S-box-containing protein